MLSEWLNPLYLQKKTILNNRKTFLRQKPFPYLKFKHFFHEEKADLILQEIQKEKFFLKESDLFKFKQTQDLQSSTNKILQEFRRFLSSKEFIKYLEELTGYSLKINAIDMAGTVYEDTDFLLPHDDRLEGRKIAYLYYLSDLTTQGGGQLNLFSSNHKKPTAIGKQIIPQFNTFAFFLVSQKSFHSVEEVIGQKQRYALSGWFHGN